MTKPVLISGIQPTGKLHIGNYLGALKNFVDLQNSGKYQCYFFIADLHALTENPKAEDLNANVIDLAADFLAAGLNPKKSTIFIQSQMPSHTELAWILNTLTPFGELSRMTQFKEKSAGQKNNVNAGLFTYPVLQAADILLYNAEFVPVGNDQLQHLELTRTLARKFNNKFGKTFVEPRAILTETPRLLSLDDHSKKMSKSRPAGCLFVGDPEKVIREKIKGAVTDSGREIKYDPKNKPAISNLMKIYEAFGGATIKTIERRFKGRGYMDFKKELAEVAISGLAPFQARKKYLAKRRREIESVLSAGAKKARQVSQKTLQEAKKKIGLTIFRI